MNIPKYLDEFRNEITRKGFRKNTIDNYTSCLSFFLKKFNGVVSEPKKINETQIKEFLSQFKSK